MGNINENAQSNNTDTASTMVVMKGFATTAGSRCNHFAKMGNIAPTNFAAITAQNKARDMIKLIKGL